MIIYGHRSRTSDIATGEFFCPHCQASRSFKQKRVDRYLTLFFIPVLRLGRLGEYVECQTCLTTHEVTVLNLPLAGPAAAGQPSAQTANIRPVIPDHTPRGCTLAVLGSLATVIGILLGLFIIIAQLTDESGPGDNLTGFFGVLIICPTPLVLLGLAALIGGLVIIWRNRRKTNAPA